MRANTAQQRFADAPSRGKRSPGTSFLSDPIAWLDDDHQRQLATCDILEQVIRNPRHSAVGSDIETAYWCLGEALPLHIADEEEAILPLLARRCGAGDRLGEVSAVLRDNHVSERLLADGIVGELERLMDGESLARPVRFFSDTIRLYRLIRQHITWENNILIPLARRRLRDLDHPFLMDKMAGRRRMRPRPVR